MKERVLELLSREQGYVSGQEMSTALGVSRAAVWKAVEALRKEGYEIDSAPRRGYCLMACTGKLSRREILRCLGNHPWARNLQVLETVDSTNNLAKSLASQGAPAGTVLVAECQTAGRGRLGRSFCSEAGQGIYLSVILRPQEVPNQLMHLTCGVAEATCIAIERVSGKRPGIKWTNDLVYGGRKLAGILTELSFEAESGRVQYAVVGIGINCNQNPEDFPPELREIGGSVRMMTGREVDRNRLTGELIQELHELSMTLLQKRLDWMEGYRKDCVTIGRAVAVQAMGETRWGQAVGVDDWGALLVDFGQGVETVQAGEVSVRGMYGYV